MTVLEGCFFLDWGFMAGDWRTARAGFLVDVDVVFLLDFFPGAGPLAEVTLVLLSMFMSIGDVVSEVSDPRRAPYTDRWVAWCWASSAGEVRGLKYSPGMVYSGMRNCASTGVTAGDTNGVNIIYSSISVILSSSHDLAILTLSCCFFE